MDNVSRLVNSVKRNKDRLTQQSRQRRGGVTDLYALDYTDNIDNDGTDTAKRKFASFRLTVSGDLDRFQRWFIKVLVVKAVSDGSKTDVVPLSDVHMTVHATDKSTGITEELDLTPLLKKKYPCNWIGDDPEGEGIFPNEDPMTGYDLMDIAWYLSNRQRKALYSPGEKIFTISAVGEAQVTIRNFIKFSHIN